MPEVDHIEDGHHPERVVRLSQCSLLVFSHLRALLVGSTEQHSPSELAHTRSFTSPLLFT